MLWRKAWLECRTRLLLCFFMSTSVMVSALLRPPKVWEDALAAMSPSEEERVFRVVFGLLALMIVPIGALILAGSGINTQTSWGMMHGFHPSMYFLLSLPVTREKLLRVRVLAGLGLLFGWIVVTVVMLLAWAQLTKAPLQAERVWAAVPNLMVGATLFFFLAVFLTSFLDEYWASMTALLLMGMAAGYGIAEGPGGANLMAYMSSDGLVAGDAQAWLRCFAILAICSVFYLAAWRIIAAKEY
jgi:hypothetical protein